MSPVSAAMWIIYIGAILGLSKWASGKSGDALMPGRIGAVVQAFAYVATYVSAVALVGFGGLCYRMGLQMMIMAAGTVWVATWFVYRYLAWPTKLWQRRLGARTPAELIAMAYGAPRLRPFLGAVTSLLLILYSSAVFKGAALMLTAAVPFEARTILIILVAVVGIGVLVGGLRGVLYTEALQGFIMAAGVTTLFYSVLKAVGGPIDGIRALASLPPDQYANRGFAAVSSGAQGLDIMFLTIIMTVGVWSQPQLIQRHFALRSRQDVDKVAPIAMLVVALVVGGTFFVGALSRLVLGPDAGSPDGIIPILVSRLMSEWGRQLFVLAVVSASLSTASALIHVVSSSVGHDVMGRKLGRGQWFIAVTACSTAAGLLATQSNALISFVCAASWTVIACASLVPYLSLIAWGPRLSKTAVWASSIGGTAASVGWYLVGYAPSAAKITGITAPGLASQMHPFLVGICTSIAAAGMVMLKAKTVGSVHTRKGTSPLDPI